MSQQDAIRTVGTAFDHLEPAMNPNHARTKHCVLIPAAGGTYVHYPKGQIVRQKNDGSNQWAKYGTAGYGGPCMIINLPILVNDAGDWQITDQALPIYGETWNKGSVDAFYQGYFRCEDVVSAGGTNEVQTETVTATGGTRTLSLFGYTTAAIAFDANAAAIKAAILLAVPVLASADIAVTGTGPFVYTFGGAYAGTNVGPITVNAGSLTGGSSSIAETTPGAGLLTGVGRLVQGTSSVGIFELGAATPV